MAQLLILEHARCNEKRCNNLAVRELMSAGGILVGRYCVPCGIARVESLQTFEDQEAEAGRTIPTAAHG